MLPKSPDPLVIKKERFNRRAVLAKPWNQYQQNIFEWAKAGSGHAIVEARAGSGKTTLLQGIVATLPSNAKIVVAAFNRHIANEIAGKLPSSVTVGTAHRLGMGLLTRYFGGQVFKPNEHKYREIATQVVNTQLVSQWRDYTRMRSQDPEKCLKTYPVGLPDLSGQDNSSKQRLRNVIKYLGELVRFTQLTLTEPTSENLTQLVDYYCIEFEENGTPDWIKTWVFPLVETVLELGEQLAGESINISLDDLLWLPNRWQIQPTHKDFLLVDELQDLNLAMQGIYLSYAKEGARIIGVGDPAQSFYGFTGSDPEAMLRLKTALNCQVFPLSVCYRCPASHLDLARHFVPDIENKPDAISGIIQVIAPDQVKGLAQSGDLILCRLTAPLISLCLTFIAHQRKAQVRGRNIGTGLVSLAKQALNDMPLSSLRQALGDYCRPRIDKLRADNLDLQADALEDRRDALLCCFESFYTPTITFAAFAEKIESLFCEDTDNPPITLSTVHRAKGDQSDRVFLLGTNLLPFNWKAKHDWQLQQEQNLVYVALTRAMQTLFLVPLPAKTGEPLNETLLEDPLGGLTLPDRCVGSKPHWTEADYIDAVDLITQWPAECPQEFKQWIESLEFTPEQKAQVWGRLSEDVREKVKGLMAIAEASL